MLDNTDIQWSAFSTPMLSLKATRGYVGTTPVIISPWAEMFALVNTVKTLSFHLSKLALQPIVCIFKKILQPMVGSAVDFVSRIACPYSSGRTCSQLALLTELAHVLTTSNHWGLLAEHTWMDPLVTCVVCAILVSETWPGVIESSCMYPSEVSQMVTLTFLLSSDKKLRLKIVAPVVRECCSVLFSILAWLGACRWTMLKLTTDSVRHEDHHEDHHTRYNL